LSDAEASGFWTGKAVDFIISNPATFFELVWKKSVYLVSGFENSDANDIYYQRGKSFSYSLLVWDKVISFPFGLLLPIFIVGLLALRKDFKDFLPLYIFILAYVPTIVLFLVTARHRLPLVPFMIVIAAGGIYTLIKCIKTQAALKLFLASLVFAASLLVFNTKYYELGIPNPFQIHFNDGLTYYRLGQFERAEEEYLLADQAFPYSAALTVNLAEVQMQLGKNDDADRNLARALVLNPQLAMAYNNLGVLVQSKGNLDSAQHLFGTAISFYTEEQSRPNEIGEYYVNLAAVLEKRNKIDSASWAFRQSMIHAPEYAVALYQAGAFYARNGMYDRADSAFSIALQVQPPKASDLYNWGLSYIQRDMHTAGIAQMHGAINIDENFHPAYYVIAAVYNRYGRPKDSVLSYLNKCLLIAPDFQPAVQLKDQIEE
jgi:tetratricopeptide (TPR) repeat protein